MPKKLTNNKKKKSIKNSKPVIKDTGKFNTITLSGFFANALDSNYYPF